MNRMNNLNLYVATFTGLRNPRTGRIISYGKFRATHRQTAAIVFDKNDDFAVRQDKLNAALKRGMVVVSFDRQHLEIYG